MPLMYFFAISTKLYMYADKSHTVWYYMRVDQGRSFGRLHIQVNHGGDRIEMLIADSQRGYL